MAEKRWESAPANRYVEDEKVDAFLADLIAVCRRHDMSLGHEDNHGAFEVHRGTDEQMFEWLNAAHIYGGGYKLERKV